MDREKILQELEKIQDEESLKEFHNKYLGKKGTISLEFKTLGNLEAQERKEKGEFLSSLKTDIENAYNIKQNGFKKQKIDKKLQEEIIDITTPGLDISQGDMTLIAQTRKDIEEIFQGMGFIVEYGNELTSKYENFYSVNIPKDHPATEMQDTFYIKQKDEKGDNLVLRTQTSNMQTALMRKYGAPLKIVIPGRVFRYESTDASHDTAFWQVEGIVIDKDISIANFKDLMKKLRSAIFKTPVNIRMRPGYFPFVEPGFELDASCPICKGDGCSLCKRTGWIELMGAGMIHPNVLKEGNIDSNKYKGFAFGLGLTRLVAIKYGIKDIRLFTNGDLRFIKSF